jgi:predicted  nucleic acid-binding Zn-ribbon protein
MIKGHYQKLAELKARLLLKSAVYADADEQPYMRHAAKVDSEMLRRELAGLEQVVADDENLISQLEEILDRLAESKHQSRDRSLVGVKIEEAVDRLYRSLGDEEVVSKP